MKINWKKEHLKENIKQISKRKIKVRIKGWEKLTKKSIKELENGMKTNK